MQIQAMQISAMKHRHFTIQPCFNFLHFSCLNHPSRFSFSKGATRLALMLLFVLLNHQLKAEQCTQTVYLTFDTGSQSQAQYIADTLHKHSVKASFFLANEKTVRGDYSLDPSWTSFYKALVSQGHAFGTHTFDHVYLQSSTATAFKVKPQFGAKAAHIQTWDAAQYCAELQRSAKRFNELTGAVMDKMWRAPGGRVSQATSSLSSTQIGRAHV